MEIYCLSGVDIEVSVHSGKEAKLLEICRVYSHSIEIFVKNIKRLAENKMKIAKQKFIQLMGHLIWMMNKDCLEITEEIVVSLYVHIVHRGWSASSHS